MKGEGRVLPSEQAAYVLVRDALTALGRGNIAEHLASVADDVVLDQIVGGQPVPPITDKVMYRTYLLQGSAEAGIANFNVYGPAAAVVPPPGIGRRATDDLIWIRAELRFRATASPPGKHPLSGWGNPHIWFGVAENQICAVEVSDAPPQGWRGQIS